jgi:hypothetical protein
VAFSGTQPDPQIGDHPIFNQRELATLLAALLFWSEENAPNHYTADCYLKSVRMTGVEPLTVDEIKQLSQRLRKMCQPE